MGFDYDVSSCPTAPCPVCLGLASLGLLGPSDVPRTFHRHLPAVYCDVSSYLYDACMAAVDCRRWGDGGRKS